MNNTMKAVKFAYRHTWRSGRLGFVKALTTGVEVYHAQDELKFWAFVSVWVNITVYVLMNYKWVV